MHMSRRAIWLSLAACAISMLCLISVVSSKKHKMATIPEEDELEEEDFDWDDE